jgi:hypothetical protein
MDKEFSLGDTVKFSPAYLSNYCGIDWLKDKPATITKIVSKNGKITDINIKFDGAALVYMVAPVGIVSV